MHILLAILTVRPHDEHSSRMDASKQGIQPVSYVPLEDLRGGVSGEIHHKKIQGPGSEEK